jgi:hypothetical protein
LKVLNGLFKIRTGRLKKQDVRRIVSHLRELNSPRRKTPVMSRDAGATTAL